MCERDAAAAVPSTPCTPKPKEGAEPSLHSAHPAMPQVMISPSCSDEEAKKLVRPGALAFLLRSLWGSL